MRILVIVLCWVLYGIGLCILFREAMWARALRKTIEKIMEEDEQEE